jgi:two-component system chemotaxis response regulator CheY
MKILVVDDEFVALTKMISVLEPFGTCDAATNGAQGIQMFAAAVDMGASYDLITLDIEMPGASGLEALKTIRQREQLRQVPPAKIIMVSAASSRANVASAAEGHCDAFLVKPVSRETLLQTLQKLGISAPAATSAQ